MNKPPVLDNPLEDLFRPEQLNFFRIVETEDLESAIKKTGVPSDTLYQWQREEAFQLYMEELVNQAADKIYLQVIKQAQHLITRCSNLSEFMSIPEQTEALESIVKLVAMAQEKKKPPYRQSNYDRYYDAYQWNLHKEKLDPDYEEEEDEDDDDDDYYRCRTCHNTSCSKQSGRSTPITDPPHPNDIPQQSHETNTQDNNSREIDNDTRNNTIRTDDKDDDKDHDNYQSQFLSGGKRVTNPYEDPPWHKPPGYGRI